MSFFKNNAKGIISLIKLTKDIGINNNSANILLEQIIQIDLNELKKAEIIRDNKLIEEFEEIIKLAKEAKKDLEEGKYSKFEKIRKKMISLEKYTLFQEKIEEHHIKKLKKFWEAEIYNGYVYHGTQKIFIPNIKEFGLSPKNKPFDIRDIKLLEKIDSNYFYPLINKFYRSHSNYVYITSYLYSAINYAKSGPELLKYILPELKNYIKKNQGVWTNKEIINKLIKIYLKYYKLIKGNHPCVLYIPFRAKSLCNQIPLEYVKSINNFENFKNMFFKYYSVDYIKNLSRRNVVFFNYFNNLALHKKIEYKDIKKIEYF